MSPGAGASPCPDVRRPLATPEEIAAEPAPFPVTTALTPHEAMYPDWRRRLARNLSRRSDSRWDPLTYVHADSGIT
jgi:hypothetical protein